MRPSEQLRYWAHELAAMARTGLITDSVRAGHEAVYQ